MRLQYRFKSASKQSLIGISAALWIDLFRIDGAKDGLESRRTSSMRFGATSVQPFRTMRGHVDMTAHRDTTVRVVTFKEGNLFVAQALEVDVCAQGSTADEANRRLLATIRIEEREAIAAGRNLFDIGPAPHPFHVLYENACVTRSQARVA